MAGTKTDRGRVVVEGAALGGAVVVSTTEAVTIALVSIIKFLRLLKLQPV